MNNNNIFSHWRDSARNPRFFFVDARAALFILLWLVHIRLWTFLLAIGALIIFGIMEYFNYTMPVALRVMHGLLFGKKKYRH